MNKRFLCLAEDETGKKYSGVFEAPDEVTARKMVQKQGFKIVSLREDSDPARNYSRTDKKSWGNLHVNRFEKVYNELPPKKRKINWKNELLSYGMPLGAALIALAGIPVVMMFIRPKTPPPPPRTIVEQYFKAESDRKFEEQFTLLSESLQKKFGTPQVYDREMRKRILRKGKETVNNIEVTSETRKRASITAALFRESGLAKVEYGLKLSRGKWKIISIRDPQLMTAYLPLIDKAEGEEKRELIVELKSQTGYSDLEIDGFLENYRKEQRRLVKEEKGIVDIFDVN